jgi:ubiquinone/menaquinone biosynthesis C-methylase UbiE
MPKYSDIKPTGGDTGTPYNIHKRVRYMLDHVDFTHKKVIDCGCGRGAYVLAMLDLGLDAWGIEVNRDKVTEFKQKHPTASRERVSLGSIQAMHFANGSFDIALLNEVIEHVPDDTTALSEINRVLRQHGTLIIFAPNRLFSFETHGVYIKNRQNHRSIPPYVPFIPYIPLSIGQKVFYYWARNYWPGELRRLVRNSGFTITHTGYLWQTFENISGQQPTVIKMFSPVFRKTAALLEKVPVVQAMGISQVIIAEKR